MTEIQNNILLVSGSGRNVGKTSFIRKVISGNSHHDIVSVKITPHFHIRTNGLFTLIDNENYKIFKETNRSTGKDSSLFLQAGAKSVFVINTTDKFLKQAFEYVCSLLPQNQLMIIESAGLRKYLLPSMYIFVQKADSDLKPEAEEMKKLADIITISDTKSFSLLPEKVIFDNNWKIESQ